ncbi:hypothetical protein ACJDU8_00945 [Clostridium sp. WILCCON 0269]|uniref:Bacterial EndoU nuclease domain-containing protein n=1 Tax=Candidatus Clostridium eludens TaxID=3381663 RepID=A0ABW8SFR4_9CLOT
MPPQGYVQGNVEGVSSVDAGKQGKYVPGHNNDNPSRSQWPQGQNGVDLTQEAWMKGAPAKPDGSVRIYDFGRPVGPNGETRVKVHVNTIGNIHGYPVP